MTPQYQAPTPPHGTKIPAKQSLSMEYNALPGFMERLTAQPPVRCRLRVSPIIGREGASEMDLHKGWKAGPPQPEFELSMPSEISAISPFVDEFMERLKHYTCYKGDADDIEVALREAIANAVLHGNKEDPSKRVHLKFRCEPDGELFFVVRDEGTGFDPDKVPDPLAPENLDAEHGRGILMMRSYMDQIHYDCGGTECHMRKKPPSAKPAR